MQQRRNVGTFIQANIQIDIQRVNQPMQSDLGLSSVFGLLTPIPRTKKRYKFQ